MSSNSSSSRCSVLALCTLTAAALLHISHCQAAAPAAVQSQGIQLPGQDAWDGTKRDFSNLINDPDYMGLKKDAFCKMAAMVCDSKLQAEECQTIDEGNAKCDGYGTAACKGSDCREQTTTTTTTVATPVAGSVAERPLLWGVLSVLCALLLR